MAIENRMTVVGVIGNRMMNKDATSRPRQYRCLPTGTSFEYRLACPAGHQRAADIGQTDQ